VQQVLDELETFRKNELVDSRGLRYVDFIKDLKPNYFIVWRDIALGWGALLVLALALAAAQKLVAPKQLWPCILLASIGMGFSMLYLHNFFHEAAHYNLAKSRRLNDVLANIFLGYAVGQDVSAYRVIHFEHHRFLGTPKDTEHTYVFPLNPLFLMMTLSGWNVIRILLTRSRHLESDTQMEAAPPSRKALLLGGSLNALLLVLLWVAGWWSVSIAWFLGMISFFPFFNSLRNLLEHRSENADSKLNYLDHVHGAVNRLFGDGPLASTLGSAGFNRHLLHHWSPQISYTRLSELEHFLVDTEMGPYLATRQTSYPAVFMRLWKWK